MSDAEDSENGDAENGDGEEEPAVELGEGPDVEGVPLAQIAARFQWGIEKSAIVEREGNTDIRTPKGPRTVRDVLAEVDQPYFGTRKEFVEGVREVVGSGPVQTADR